MRLGRRGELSQAPLEEFLSFDCNGGKGAENCEISLWTGIAGSSLFIEPMRKLSVASGPSVKLSLRLLSDKQSRSKLWLLPESSEETIHD
jgi:hypothetical protein